MSRKTGTLNDLHKDKKNVYFANLTSSDAIADEMEVIYRDFMNCKGVLTREGIIGEYGVGAVLGVYDNIL